MVNGKELSFLELPEAIKTFVDNNGDGSCGYCKGEALAIYSENPKIAKIELNTASESSYKYFISIQTAISQAYIELRKDYAYKNFKKDIADLSKLELNKLQEAYPILLSETSFR